jgi:hypothetical protein
MPTLFSKLKNKLHVCVLILLISLVLLPTSLTAAVIVPPKIKIRTQCGEVLFVRILERNTSLVFNYLNPDK